MPPHELVYQAKVVPEPPIYERLVLSPGQIPVSVALTEIGATGSVLTVIITLSQEEFPQSFSQRP